MVSPWLPLTAPLACPSNQIYDVGEDVDSGDESYSKYCPAASKPMVRLDIFENEIF